MFTSITRQSGKTAILFPVVAVLALAIGLLIKNLTSGDPNTALDTEKLIILPTPKSLGEVDFIDHNGNAFTDDNLRGKWSVLFFAFTNCPDICPNTLHTMKLVKKDLEERGLWNAFQFVMVTVDPERDTPERLKKYVPYFDPEFIGLTRSEDYITEFAKNVGILFMKRPPSDDGSYDVDHSAGFILVNPNGQYAGFLGAPHTREIITQDLSKLGQAAIESGAITTNSVPQPGESSSLESKAVTSSDIEPTKDTSVVNLSFDNAWIRPAPPGAPSLAGYTLIRNNGNLPVTLVDVEAQGFDMAMIHETVVEDGIASMIHLDELTIQAGGLAELQPMGKHLMLMRPEENFPVGHRVALTFVTNDGEEIQTNFTIQPQPTQN